jgi:hypothetical protein
MCRAKVLTSTASIEVSYCHGCKTFFLWHKNILMSFSEEEFSSFCQAMHCYEFSECAWPFSDGISRLSVCTPYDQVNFVFEEEEWKDMLRALDEAALMHEAHKILEKER